MIKSVSITKRPDFSIPFFMRNAEMEELMETMRQEGKFLTETRSLSDDGLVFTYEAIWNSIDDLKEWKSHPTAQKYFAARKEYNDANGIELSVQTMDYMDDSL